MIRYTQGNLLDSGAEALVNTVNTEGVMGKGIALMFKEAFADNFKAYRAACQRGDVRVGRMFVTETRDLLRPNLRWIINFPTKQQWRLPSKLEWIETGLADLVRIISDRQIREIAIPPLGSGNGGLAWTDVRPLIEAALAPLSNVDVLVFEPTPRYHNKAKHIGVDKLTPARALVAELVRQYWILGFECSILEIQKLAYLLERKIEEMNLASLDLDFRADRYGPYADRLRHLLDALDGSYLHCEKRLADAGPLDAIAFEDLQREKLAAYLNSAEARLYKPALDATTELVDGFESPLGMELLATVDWLLRYENAEPTLDGVKQALGKWPAGGAKAVRRKQRLLDDRLLVLALHRLSQAA